MRQWLAHHYFSIQVNVWVGVSFPSRLPTWSNHSHYPVKPFKKPPQRTMQNRLLKIPCYEIYAASKRKRHPMVRQQLKQEFLYIDTNLESGNIKRVLTEEDRPACLPACLPKKVPFKNLLLLLLELASAAAVTPKCRTYWLVREDYLIRSAMFLLFQSENSSSSSSLWLNLTSCYSL